MDIHVHASTVWIDVHVNACLVFTGWCSLDDGKYSNDDVSDWF